MPPKSALGKRIRNNFYTSENDENRKWRCLCGTVRKQLDSGCANLVSHVQAKHPVEFEKVKELDVAARRDEQSQSSFATSEISALPIDRKVSYFYDPKVISVYGWIDFVTTTPLPFQLLVIRRFKNT